MEHVEKIYQFITKSLFNIKDTGITLLSLIVILLVIIIAAWLVKFISKLLEKRVFPKLKLDRLWENILELTAQIVILAIALIFVLKISGIGLGIFSATLFQIKETPIKITSLVTLTLIIMTSMFISKIVTRTLQSQIYGKFNLDIGLQSK